MMWECQCQVSSSWFLWETWHHLSDKNVYYKIFQPLKVLNRDTIDVNSKNVTGRKKSDNTNGDGEGQAGIKGNSLAKEGGSSPFPNPFNLSVDLKKPYERRIPTLETKPSEAYWNKSRPTSLSPKKTKTTFKYFNDSFRQSNNDSHIGSTENDWYRRMEGIIGIRCI